MPYLHGVRVSENPTSIPSPAVNEAGVPVIIGTAPVNLAANPAAAVNVPILCKTFAEARAAVGYSDDYDNYTLCQAMDAFFKAFGVGPVVLINVLDPAIHKASFTATAAVVDGQAKFDEAGIILSGLTATAGSEQIEEGTDYTVAFNAEGKVVITLINSNAESVSISGNKLNPSAVTSAEVIGSYNAVTGAETGIEAVRKVYPMFSITPSMLLAPGWSNDPTVGLALAEKCNGINGLFKAICIVDIDASSNGATKYTDVEETKGNFGYVSENMVALWPMVKFAGKKMAYSAIYAAMATYLDYENDSVPNLSPSNHALRISATVLADGTEVNLDVTQANELNAIGVVTAVNIGVYKAWGNNTAAYPAEKDPKDRWICCRRFFSWWGNSFITNYLDRVDNPANYRLIESIVDSENVRGNALVSQGKCAGIRMVYDKEDNPVENVMDGRIVFRQYLAPYAPAEDILNILEFDPSMIEAALGGGEA